MKKILTLLLLCISLGCLAQKQNLQLNLKLDSTYYMTTNANLTITEEIPGQTQVIGTIITGRVAHKVTAVRDSIYEMEVSYVALGMNMSLPGGQSISFNSNDKDSNSLYTKIMLTMMNRPFTIVINKSGKVLEVRNSENLYAGMLTAMPQATDAQKAQFKAQMEQSFGEKSFRGTFQDAFAVLPQKAVGINDQWVANTSIESTISIKMKTTYTLQAVTADAYQVHGSAVVDAAPEPLYKKMSGMPMRFLDVSGNVNTDIKLDRATGWISEVKTTKLVKGTMDIQDNPKVPGGMKFPMTVSGDLTVTGK